MDPATPVYRSPPPGFAQSLSQTSTSQHHWHAGRLPTWAAASTSLSALPRPPHQPLTGQQLDQIAAAAAPTTGESDIDSLFCSDEELGFSDDDEETNKENLPPPESTNPPQNTNTEDPTETYVPTYWQTHQNAPGVQTFAWARQSPTTGRMAAGTYFTTVRVNRH